MDEVQHFLKRQNSVITPSYFSNTDTSFEDLRSILMLPAVERTEAQIILLVFFTSHIKVFAEMIENRNAEAHRECCRSLFYEKHAPGEVLPT